MLSPQPPRRHRRSSPIRRVASLSLLALCLPLGCSHAALADDDDEDEADELGQVVVTATRTPTLVNDEALHVEAVPTEEIEENMTEAPGNVSSLFQELPGVHLRRPFVP